MKSVWKASLSPDPDAGLVTGNLPIWRLFQSSYQWVLGVSDLMGLCVSKINRHFRFGKSCYMETHLTFIEFRK
jgi:hypothetical protein